MLVSASAIGSTGESSSEPRLLVSGPMLRGGQEAMPGMGKIETPEDAARQTEALAKAGVDVIKAQIGITAELYVAIVETAHKYGKKVHAHVYFPDKVKAALDAGVDVLTHVGSAGTPPYTPELMREIVVSGTPVVPTGAHRVWVVPATINFPERLQDPQLKEDFGPMIYEEVQDSFKNWHTLPYFGPLIGLGDTPRQMFFGDASLKQWIDSGAVVGMGTDSGTPMNFNTEALWREIEGFRRPGHVSSASHIGDDPYQRAHHGNGARAWNHRTGKARGHHRRQRRPLVQHYGTCRRRSSRKGRRCVEGRPRICQVTNIRWRTLIADDKEAQAV